MRHGGIAALLAATACTASAPPDPWNLWTIDTLQARGDPAIVEPGATMRLLSAPYPQFGTGLQTTSKRGLTVFPAFSEGKPAAYMTTEIWENFDEVWVQPLYFDLSFQDKAIFGVDATTRFYSPYWQAFTYRHPAGAPEFRSAKDVLDSHVPLAPNTGKFCAITRDQTIFGATQEGDDDPRRPLTGEVLKFAGPKNLQAYAEGNPVRFVDLGNQQRFTFDPQTLIVDETPLYAFAVADANGFPVEIDLPRVGGTGPPHHPRCDGHANCTGVINGVPEFGALWRVYDVMLATTGSAATADVYVPALMSDLRARVQGMGFPATPTATPLADEFILRVAIDGKACFAGDPSTCHWLDSQNQIESQVVEWRVTKTGKLVTCPLIEFNGKAIPNP